MKMSPEGRQLLIEIKLATVPTERSSDPLQVLKRADEEIAKAKKHGGEITEDMLVTDKEIESKMSLDAGTSVRHTDENKFVRFAGFEVEDQIEFAVLMVMRHFLGNQKILGELYGVLYKAAIRNGKINSSEEGILNMISQNWM